MPVLTRTLELSDDCLVLGKIVRRCDFSAQRQGRQILLRRHMPVIFGPMMSAGEVRYKSAWKAEAYVAFV